MVIKKQLIKTAIQGLINSFIALGGGKLNKLNVASLGYQVINLSGWSMMGHWVSGLLSIDFSSRHVDVFLYLNSLTVF